jgi:myo-inositol-1(or 4)-monophosphatase
MVNIDDCIRVGHEAAKDAARILADRYLTEFAVTHKGAVNLVTEVDLAAEELIVSRIRGSFSSHTIIAEENYSDSPQGGISWIIDPLDGTTNFAHGYPAFSVSVGLEIEGELEWGTVVDPIRNEFYSARRGCGAFCNGTAIKVSDVTSLGASLLATGFPYDIRTSADNNLNYFCAFAVQTQGIRRSGSAALDFCALAAGRLDGFWELKLNPWDCAAGYLIVREAGGKVTNFTGRRGTIYDREVVASNSLIHDQILAVLEDTRRKTPAL